MRESAEADTCRYRRECGTVVLDCYQRTIADQEPASDRYALEQLLGDLLHACDLRGLSFVDALGRAAVEKRAQVLAELEDACEKCQSCELP